MTIGELTLDMIGTARVRTEYEGATIEGLVTGMDLDIEIIEILNAGGKVRNRTNVTVDLHLGNIGLNGLRRSHPCEVIV